MVTRPSSCSRADTRPGGVSMPYVPAVLRPRYARVATSPMVPWPHIPKYPILLKKMTPPTHAGCSDSQNRPPTKASEPRGSFTTAERMESKLVRKRSRRVAIGPPASTMRVGSPPVWESTTRIRFIARILVRAAAPCQPYPYCLVYSRGSETASMQKPLAGEWVILLIFCANGLPLQAQLHPAAEPSAVPVRELLDLLAMSPQAEKGDRARSAAIATRADWERKRQSIRLRVLEALGRGPEGSAPLSPTVLAEEKLDGYVRQNVAYRAATGEPIPAYLLIPAGLSGRRPAVLALHQTVRAGKREPVGLEGDPNLHYALELVRRGYVVLAPDSITAGERILPRDGAFVTASFDRDYPAWSAMGKMLADHRRGIDYLETLDFVDPSRIAVIGHSLGGYNSFFLAAFDTRIGAAVVSCGLGPLAGSPKPFAWARRDGFVHFPRLHAYLEAGIAPFDFHEVMALVAPRTLFNFSARQDPIFSNATAIEAAGRQLEKVYRLCGAPENLRFVMQDGPHGFPAAVRQQAYQFLDRWAK